MKRHRTLAAALALTLLCGCERTPKNGILMEFDPHTQSASAPTKVTFFGYKSDSINLVAIESTLHDFMDANPDIYVTYEGLKNTVYWDAFELRAAANCLDDVVMTDHKRVLTLSSEDKLLDLSDLSTIESYFPLIQNQITEPDGSVYFLPMCISTYNLYVNTDLLERHHQKVPTNLSEFTEVCDYFVHQGVTPIIANDETSLQSLITAKGMYSVYQSEDVRAEIEKFNRGESDILTQLRPGVELLAEMTARGWLNGGEVLAVEQNADDLALFSQGLRPFMISSGEASLRLKTDFSYGVYPYPILDDGSVLSINLDTCVSVNAQSPRVEEAKTLLEFITQPDVIWAYCDSQSSYTPMKDAHAPSNPVLAPSTPYLTNGRNVLESNYNLEFPIDASLKECGKQIMKGMDADSAMELLASLLYPSDEAAKEGVQS